MRYLQKWREANRIRLREHQRKHSYKDRAAFLERQRERRSRKSTLKREEFIKLVRGGLRHRHAAILEPFVVRTIKGLIKIGGREYLIQLMGDKFPGVRGIKKGASWRWLEGSEENDLYEAVRTICLNDPQFTLRWMIMAVTLEIRFQYSLGYHRNEIKKDEKYERRKQFLAFCHRVCASL